MPVNILTALVQGKFKEESRAGFDLILITAIFPPPPGGFGRLKLGVLAGDAVAAV